MGKGNTVLGLITLILAAGGLGLGGLAWIETQSEDVSIPTSWFKYNTTSFYADPVGWYVHFEGLTIEFELGPGEAVYFSFSCQAHVEVTTGWSRISVFFRVDDLTSLTPSTQVGMYNGGFTNHYSVNLQYIRDDLLPGVHNVTPVITSSYSGNYIKYSSLFVQTIST